MAGNDNPGGGRGRDATVLRPTPGGTPGGRAGGVTQGVGAGRAAIATPAAADAPVDDFIARSANPILTAAGPLLSLGATIGSSAYQADVEGLRSRAIDAVVAFETRLNQGGVAADQVRLARYLVCTFVDTAVLHTPWGGQETWSAKSLLSKFNEDLDGGRNFFDLLKGFSETPDKYLDLLELQYVCLGLGFLGMYRGQPNGPGTVAAIQDRLYRLIRDKRSGLGSVLATHWQGLAEPKTKSWRIVPWWVVGIAAACVLVAALITLHQRLSQAAAGPNALLTTRSAAAIDYRPEPPRAAPSRLKVLLAAAERAGKVSVDEFGPRTVVTLNGPELFQSGSAAVTPGQEALFAEIGRALEAVPGRVLIVGHTDDQPVRSLRYDNFELSRQRALAVAQLLKPYLSRPSRLDYDGLGSTRPRFEPASLPENRARNRRVEIQHFAE